MGMLPSPLKLQSGQFGRKSVYYHLHNPRTIVLGFPRALSDFTIMLPMDAVLTQIELGVDESTGEHSPNSARGARGTPNVCPEIRYNSLIMRIRITLHTL